MSFTVRKLLVCGLLATGCAGTVHQRTAYATPQTTTTEVQPFYAELSPYGQWVDSPRYGRVWMPRDDAQPYTNGHWVYGDQGFTWVSDEPYGWATEHYGRWTQIEGRWAWIPGREWSPAWVGWSESGEAVGWAPLGPDDRPLTNQIRYVPYDRFQDRDVRQYYVRPEMVRQYRENARPVARVSPDYFQRHNVTLVPQRVQLRRIDVSRPRPRVEEERDHRASPAWERRDDSAERRLAEQQRRAEARERRGGWGANPGLDARDREQDRLEAERAERDRQAADRALERNRLDQQQVARDSRDEQRSVDALQRRHADERQALLRSLEAKFAGERADLQRRGRGQDDMQRLVQRQAEVRRDALSDLDRRQRTEMNAEIQRHRTNRQFIR